MITYLGIRQALFFAWLNDTDSEDEDGDDNADGDNDGERALSDGGGTDMSTLGRGTTPVMEYDGERGNWSLWAPSPDSDWIRETCHWNKTLISIFHPRQRSPINKKMTKV